MASTVTHAYFVIDVYERLPIKRKIFLKDEVDSLKTFSQSLDPLFFYSSFNLKKAKKVRAFGNYFHNKKTGEYIITLINYIKYNYYKNNPQVMGFLYSMISHYILDSKVHPYIFYKTGNFNPKNKDTYKYNAKHHIYETAIDEYLIETREKYPSWKYKHYDLLFKKNTYSKELLDVINFSFKETYNIDDFSTILKKSTKNMKLAYRLLRYDPTKIKLYGYKIIDALTPKKVLKLSFLSYHNYTRKIEFINLKKNKWYYPTNKRKCSNKSFVELYVEALNECVNIIKEVDQYIYNDKKTNLKNIIKNYSYATGVDLSRKQELKYFEY